MESENNNIEQQPETTTNPQTDKMEEEVQGEQRQDFEAVTVKPSEEMKQQKIKYGVIGKDLPVDPEATVKDYLI